MTVSDMAKVMEYLKTAYPMAWRDVNEKRTLAVWADQFAGDEPEIVQMAVKAFVAMDASGYPPSIGQIKHMAYELRNNTTETAQEAWTHIRAAISNSGYYSGEEFEKLSPVEQRLAGSPRQLYDWSQMSVETLDSVVASNVMRSFKAVQEKEQYRAMLPPAVKAFAERMLLEKV